MIKALVFLGLVSVAFAISCSSAADGYYCNADLSYTLCSSGYSYHFACAAGTGCACGTDQSCTTPCSAACETGSSSAQPFCNSVINTISESEGYFCNPDGTGFYQCVRDAYCPTQSSPRSALQFCAPGTVCRCRDTSEECSSELEYTPCVYVQDPEVCSISSWYFAPFGLTVDVPSLSATTNYDAATSFTKLTNSDGTVSFAVTQNGVTAYLMINPSGCTYSADNGCGSVGLESSLDVYGMFNVLEFSSGRVLIQSAADTNVYLRLYQGGVNAQYYSSGSVLSDNWGSYEDLNLNCA